MNKILCIGPCSNVKSNYFTGQSVMFDGIVNFLEKHGVVVCLVNISPRNSKNGYVSRLLDYIIIITNLLIKLLFNRITLCYITTSQSKQGFIRDYVLITLCKWFHVPVIAHQYGANLRQLTSSLGEKGTQKLKNLLSVVKIIIVEGDYMKEQYSFLPDFESKIKVIPNGLPIEGKHARHNKAYDTNKPFVMFYLSNLIWSKGYFDVLKAVDILVNIDKMNVKCIFAGKFMASIDDERPGISKKEDFDKFILDKNLGDYVEYYPGLYGDAKDEMFYNSNIFILPTYYINEGQPVSIIEAMAYGCVPLVTNYRHIPMMVNNSNGCYVEPKTPSDIADKVKYLMSHPEEYEEKSKQSILDYQQKFMFDVYAEKVMKCINNIVS